MQVVLLSTYQGIFEQFSTSSIIARIVTPGRASGETLRTQSGSEP